MRVKSLLFVALMLVTTFSAWAQKELPSRSDKTQEVEFRSDIRKQLKEMQKPRDVVKAMDKEAQKAYFSELVKLKTQLRSDAPSRNVEGLVGKKKEKASFDNSKIASPDNALDVPTMKRDVNKSQAFSKTKRFKNAMEKSEFLCGKHLDTTLNYSWFEGAWMPTDRGIWVYDDNGNVTQYTSYEYAEVSSEWIAEYRWANTWENGNLMEEVYREWSTDDSAWVNVNRYLYQYDDMGNETLYQVEYWDATEVMWVPDIRYVKTFDANGYMATRQKDYYDAEDVEWDFGWHDSYSYTAEGMLEWKSWDKKDDAGEFHPWRYWKFDPGYWPVGTTYFNEEDGLLLEYYEKDGFDAATGEFNSGNKDEYTYMEVDPYYHEDFVEKATLVETYTSYNLDTLGNWVGAYAEGEYSYDKYGNWTGYTQKNYSGDAWQDTIRYTISWTNHSYTCDDQYDGAMPKTYRKEINTQEDWKDVYYVMYYDPAFGEIVEEYNLTWDVDSAAYVSGSRTLNSWNYDINLYMAYKQLQFTWDYENQEWLNTSHFEFYNGPVYMGNGSVGSAASSGADAFYLTGKYSLFINKVYDVANETWFYYEKDTTSYNANGQPVEFEEYGTGLAKNRREVIEYTDAGNVSAYTGYTAEDDAWVEEEAEWFTYNDNGQVTQYKEQVYGESDWVNVFKTDYYYDETTYSTVNSAWDEDYWLHQDSTVWGSDWDKHAVWDTTGTEDEWLWTEWYFDQDFTWAQYVGSLIPSEDVGLKVWNAEDEEWDYSYKLIWDWTVNCGGTGLEETLYQIAFGSSDGSYLINDTKIETSYGCPGDVITSQYEYTWDNTAGEWFALSYLNQEIGSVDPCTGIALASSAGYKWNSEINEYVRWSGFEDTTIYNANGQVIESWNKSWTEGELSGDRYLYTYTDDGYMSGSIYQTVNSLTGQWMNVQKGVDVWNGVATLETAWTKQDATCFGSATGMIDVNVNGGTEPYSYDWEGDTATTQDLMSATAGNYRLTVTDANGCTTQTPYITLEQNTKIHVKVSWEGASNAADEAGGLDGKAWVSEVKGGVPPYSYLWNDPMDTEADTVTGLKAGQWAVTVTDQAGCSETSWVTIAADPTATAIEDILANKNLAVYPNPTRGPLNIAVSEKFQGSTLTIYNNAGKALYNKVLNSQQEDMDLSNLDAGIYILRVQHNEQISTHKLLVR